MQKQLLDWEKDFDKYGCYFDEYSIGFANPNCPHITVDIMDYPEDLTEQEMPKIAKVFHDLDLKETLEVKWIHHIANEAEIAEWGGDLFPMCFWRVDGGYKFAAFRSGKTVYLN